MSENKQNKKNKAEEPATSYGNTIRVFSSFEEMNEADAREVAQFTHEQHLNHATELIERVFHEELKKKMDKALYFK